MSDVPLPRPAPFDASARDSCGNRMEDEFTRARHDEPAREVEIEISPGLRDALAERHALGPDHTRFIAGALGNAGLCYAQYAIYTVHFQTERRVPIDRLTYKLQAPPRLWPFPPKDIAIGLGVPVWEPRNPRRDLIRGIAFMLFELDRLDDALEASLPPAKPDQPDGAKS